MQPGRRETEAACTTEAAEGNVAGLAAIVLTFDLPYQMPSKELLCAQILDIGMLYA